jgi:hypothetical protein
MIEISKKTAQELVWEGESDGFTVVKKVITAHSRWAILYMLVFRRNDDGQLFGADYRVGATEYQDEEPFQYQDPVKCFEVEEALLPAFVRKTDLTPTPEK